MEVSATPTSYPPLDNFTQLSRLLVAGLTVLLCLAPGQVAQRSSSSVTFRNSLILHNDLPRTSKNAHRYVSPNGSDADNGTKHHPWATINHAASLASPGLIIHVAPGTYSEAVVTPVSGTAEARIIFVSDEDWGALIVAPGRDGFAWTNTGNYIDVIGFEIGGGRCGGIGLGGSFQRAIANNVHNSAAGCTTSDGGSGINDYNYTQQGNEIIRNYVHDVGIGEPLCGQFRHNYIQGIYQANPGGQIDHNMVVNSCGFGIHLWHAASHASITNNTVIGNKAGAILIGSGDAPCSTTGCPGNDYTIVKNNIVAFNGNTTSGGYGISEREQRPGRTGPHNEYSHNLSFKNLSGDFSMATPCKSCITGKDPAFVSVSSGDYRLSAGSPAIAAGELSELEKASKRSSPPTDIGALPNVRDPLL